MADCYLFLYYISHVGNALHRFDVIVVLDDGRRDTHKDCWMVDGRREEDLDPIDAEKNSQRFLGNFEPSGIGLLHAKTACNNLLIARWYLSWQMMKTSGLNTTDDPAIK